MLESIANNLSSHFHAILSPESRVYPLYLVSAFVLALLAYVQVERAHADEDAAHGNDASGDDERPTFLQYVFNPRIIFHPSTRQDVKYFFVNSLVYYALISQFLISAHALSTAFHSSLISWFGELSAPILSTGVGIVLYTVLSSLALDLGVYVMHYLFHRIPLLWEFHKVHHSAEELNPVTLFRMHPVDLFLTGLVVAVFNAIAFAGMFYLTGNELSPVRMFGLNIIVFLFYLFGYNLRHSHMWLNYPAWLSRILISPAQHQIHHSSDPKHYDKNFGLIFSFWDQLMGTSYIPKKYEKLNFGLSPENPNPFKSVADLYIKPFVWAGEIVKTNLSTSQGRTKTVIVTSGLILATVLAWWQYDRAIASAGPEVVSVKLEELTWTEVHAALDRGYKTVIIPTGGTEQNGPFVILGKHHFVVDFTSGAIARKLGKTLVAPVMDYVPEGEITPQPTGHMQFTGTISIPETVFESVLEHTARSLKHHGFTEIFFLGDSGGNQESQRIVARKLCQEWAEEGVRVATLDEYYSGNGQFQTLQESGYPPEEIGWHAGIRDTSELLAIDDQKVRLVKRNVIKGVSPGFSGAANKASVEIGQEMLLLKIEAALKQVRSIRNTPIDQLNAPEEF